MADPPEMIGTQNITVVAYWRARAEVLQEALLAAREVLDYIDGHGCDDDSREAEQGWKAIDAALAPFVNG